MPEDQPNQPPSRATERAVGESVERFIGLSKEQIREALRSDLAAQSVRDFRPSVLTGIPPPPEIKTEHMEFQRHHSEVTPPPKTPVPESGPGGPLGNKPMWVIEGGVSVQYTFAANLTTPPA